MRRDLGRRDPVATAQILDQSLCGRDLPRRRRLLIQVAHEADPDPVLVHVVATGIPAMDALFLQVPSLGHLDLAVAAPDLNARKGEETISWKGKEIACKTLFGSFKKEGEAVEFKAWINDDVPGGVVKRTRTTKQKDDTITTTITLVSYKAGK